MINAGCCGRGTFTSAAVTKLHQPSKAPDTKGMALKLPNRIETQSAQTCKENQFIWPSICTHTMPLQKAKDDCQRSGCIAE
jgi:hypothetical protein